MKKNEQSQDVIRSPCSSLLCADHSTRLFGFDDEAPFPLVVDTLVPEAEYVRVYQPEASPSSTARARSAARSTPPLSSEPRTPNPNPNPTATPSRRDAVAARLANVRINIAPSLNRQNDRIRTIASAQLQQNQPTIPSDLLG